jgi:hypothetical protein
MTHTCFGRSNFHPIGQLTHTRCSDGAPEPDGVLKTVVRNKIRHCRQLVTRPKCFLCQTVKHLLWLMNYRRNRINFAFFALLLGVLYHYRVFFVRDVLCLFYLLSSFSFLHVLSKWHMLGVYFRTLSASLLIIVLSWHFLSSVLVFCILLYIK